MQRAPPKNAPPVGLDALLNSLFDLQLLEPGPAPLTWRQGPSFVALLPCRFLNSRSNCAQLPLAPYSQIDPKWETAPVGLRGRPGTLAFR